LHGWFYVHGPPQAPKGLPTGRRRFYDGSVSRAAAQRRSGARSASRATARRQVARILRGEPRRLCGVAYGARAPNGRSFAVGRGGASRTTNVARARRIGARTTGRARQCSDPAVGLDMQSRATGISGER
jgi:hypothetical protein